MASNSNRNALRRLQTILNDEDYGPKLARLNRADERRVLDLIEQNKGKQARSEILRLDEARRAKRRGRVKPINIDELRRQAFANIRRQVNGHPKTVRLGVDLMTPDELQYAAAATDDEIRVRAGDRSYAKYYDEIDDDYNVFWYK